MSLVPKIGSPIIELISILMGYLHALGSRSMERECHQGMNIRITLAAIPRESDFPIAITAR